MLIDIMDKNIEIKTYDYYEVVKADLVDYINENYNVADFKNISDNEIDNMYDRVSCDNITGNIDGSYWCNTWKAEKALFGNTNLLMEAIEYFEFDLKNNMNAETLDVIIREYVLSNIFYETIKELTEDK